ncbi:MAG TPA: outer membrane beta-barrel protein, partial [Chitinophagaceae bacterium]
HNLEINNRYNDYESQSDISYYYPLAYDSLYSQLRMERIPRTDVMFMFNYSEPLNKNLTIRLAGRYEYGQLHNGIGTFNSVNGNDKYDTLNTSLSSDFRRISNRAFLGAGLEYKWKDLTITPSVRILNQHVNNRMISSNTLIEQQQFNVLPVFSIVYKQLNLGYNRDIILPGYSSLNPVTDLSNPYFIMKGNPDLLSSKRDNINLNYYYNNAKRYINVGGYVSASFTSNDIIQSISVDDKGVQTSYPINVNGTENYSMNWNINKQYKNKQNRIFMWNIGNWMGVTRSLMFFNGIESRQTTFNYNQWMGIGLNLNDKFEWNMNYSFGRNFTKYTNPYFQELKVSNYDWSNELVLRWPKHLIWETQFSYAYNGSIPKGYPKETIRWNGALNITMLKNEAGVLKLSVNDILDRNQNIWVSANRNTITTTENNILGRYFLATFTYNVRLAGMKKKVGGRERLFMF